jgi:hypothetical protein
LTDEAASYSLRPMSSQSHYDLDGQERMRREFRDYQRQQGREIFDLEFRLGRYAKWQPGVCQPPPFWDGVKNSQIIPLSR